MERPIKWEDVWGETEVEIGPGDKVKITERKSGDVTERTEEKPAESAFEKLTDAEKTRVFAEIKNFEENARGYSPEEIEEERQKIMKDVSEKILASRE